MTYLSEAPIVGVTSIFYPDPRDVRFEVALETMEGWSDRGIPVVVIDGSPVNERGVDVAKKAFEERGAVVLRSEVDGIASQRQQGARHVLAEGGQKIITHEPEKPSIPGIALEIGRLLDSAEIVVIGRTEESKQTMPTLQRRTEGLAGWILERTLLLPPDALAGPRGYSKRGMGHLLNYPSHEPGMNNWLYMYENLLQAKKAGQRILGFAAPLMYPQSITTQETNSPIFDRKRYEQFVGQLRYMLALPEAGKSGSESERLATEVRMMLAGLSSDPTNEEYAEFIQNTEIRMREGGYNAWPMVITAAPQTYS